MSPLDSSQRDHRQMTIKRAKSSPRSHPSQTFYFTWASTGDRSPRPTSRDVERDPTTRAHSYLLRPGLAFLAAAAPGLAAVVAGPNAAAGGVVADAQVRLPPLGWAIGVCDSVVAVVSTVPGDDGGVRPYCCGGRGGRNSSPS